MFKPSTRLPLRAPFLALTAAATAVVVAMAACGSDPVAANADQDLTASARSVQAQLDADFKTLRQATDRFHSFEQAKKEGYTFLFMDMCMDSPAGGMGYHYVNTGLLSGNLPDIAKPQALLYEPASNGSPKLVAVEYVIPKDAWQGPGDPYLFGQKMELNSFDLYALHVWLYKENPLGIFKPWNPNVSCQYAS